MYFFVFTWNWWVYSFLSEHRSIIEHMISMAAIWNTGMKHRLPQFKQKLNIINMVNAAYKFLCKQNHLKTLYFCVSLKYEAQYSVSK